MIMHGPGKIGFFSEHDKWFFKRFAGFQINDLRSRARAPNELRSFLSMTSLERQPNGDDQTPRRSDSMENKLSLCFSRIVGSATGEHKRGRTG
jgi:hypothetical protein